MSDPLNNAFAGTEVPASDILALVEAMPQLKRTTISFEKGSTILKEGELNDRLTVLIEGRALLKKQNDAGRSVEVDTFGPGALLGLTSFWGRSPVFASIEADTDVYCIAIDRTLFDSLTSEHPEFVRAVQALFVRNLSDRYRNMIRSQMARERLAVELEEERNQLRDTLSKLEQMTSRLVNQEKLATLGQLLAGIAHEINNPVGALLRGVDMAAWSMHDAFSTAKGFDMEGKLVREGLECPFWSSEEKRVRMDSFAKTYPWMGRPLARRLSQLTEPAFALIKPYIKEGNAQLEHLLPAYEAGVCFRAVRISAGRIEKIVTSLRSYGRQDSSQWEDADLVVGIQDTLTVLNNRLKRYELVLDLRELVPFCCNMGEINQVWTNLLVNAMDATEEGGRIEVKTLMDGKEAVVCIEDSGTGIAEEKLETIFEANYTTKNSSGSFGLGLGLSISREIVEKHGGSLKARNRTEGGACFEARFPVGTGLV